MGSAPAPCQKLGVSSFDWCGVCFSSFATGDKPSEEKGLVVSKGLVAEIGSVDTPGTGILQGDAPHVGHDWGVKGHASNQPFLGAQEGSKGMMSESVWR